MNKTGFQTKNNYFRAALYIELIVNNMKYRGIQCDFGRLTNVFFVTPDPLLIAVQRDTDFFQYTYCGRVFNPAQKGVLNKAGFAMHDPIAIRCMNAIMRECENPEHKTGHRSLVIACPTVSVRRGHWPLVIGKQESVCALCFAPESRNIGTEQAVEFIQQIKEYTKREENIEYRISNIEFRSGAANQVPHSLILIPYSLFPNPLNAENIEQRARNKEQAATSQQPVAPSDRVIRAGSSQQPATSIQQPATREISTVYQIEKPSATETWFPAEGCVSEPQAIRACLLIRVFNN